MLRTAVAAFMLMGASSGALAQQPTKLVRLYAVVKAAEFGCREAGYTVEARKAEETVAKSLPTSEVIAVLSRVMSEEAMESSNLSRDAWCARASRRYPQWIYR